MIGALEETLQEEAIDTLIIIPDGALSMIPFAALYDGENFLIEKYAIVTTPSLQLTDPQPVPRENFEALLVGLSEGVQGFPPLPNVPEELETIGKILQGNSEQLLNQAYEKKALTDAVTQNTYRIIHMATHGEFSADPNETFLLTYDGRLPLNQFGSLLRLGQFSDEPVELLTLSACNTAVGDVRAAFGLAGIALESGARSAVATLWSVHDEATMLAMTDFYKHFQSRPDLNKAQALQAAQLNLLNQPQYKHPAYWSPFLFIGNWL
jgi:CHAT domain-containing protein